MSIVRIADLDIAAALAVLPDFEEIWGEDRWRQELRFSPGDGIDTIWLRRQPGSRPRDVLHQLASVATRHYSNGALSAVIHQVCAYVEGRPARASLVRFAPGARIEPHTQIGIYADNTESFHVPIITNPGAWFRFGDERYHMTAGGIFALDRQSEHEGANDGDTSVVHLVCDVHPDSAEVLAS